jgi:hypothetical protein
MMHRRTARNAVPLTAGLVLLAAFVLAPDVGAAPQTRPGCTTRAAVAHDGLGHRLRPATRGPVACAVQTGYQTSETRIGIANDGTVVQFPALLPQEPAPNTNGAAASGFATSHNNGATWQASQVKLAVTGSAHPSWTSQDVNFFVDRATGRIFASAPQLLEVQPNLAYSDDSGKTWTTSRPPLGYSVENPNFLFAKPRTSQTSGYPNVVYYCENLTPFGSSTRFCSKSLDGGNSWNSIEEQGFTGSAVVPAHSECGADREEFSPGGEGYPVAQPDGSLVLIVSCGGKHFMARSLDEAKSWPIVRGRNGQPLVVRHLAGRVAPIMRADSAGNLYVVSQVGDKLLLSTSTDGGRTWSREHNMVPPGVGAAVWYMQAREPGHVAVSFYAPRREGTMVDAWLSETRNALSGKPVFWSAMVNNPTRPALWTSRGNAPWPLLDFIGVDIGPDGSVWGSFIQDCGPNLGDGIACKGRPTYNNVGLVGSLSWESG